MKIHARNPTGDPSDHSLKVVNEDGTEYEFPGHAYKWNLSMEVGRQAQAIIWVHSTMLDIIVEDTKIFTTFNNKKYELVEIK